MKNIKSLVIAGLGLALWLAGQASVWAETSSAESPIITVDTRDGEISSAESPIIMVDTRDASPSSAESAIITVDTRDSVWEPQIDAQPQPQTVTIGGSFTLQVTAQGLEPFSFQWQQNGTNLTDGGRISGATSNQLTIANSLASDGGTYSVVVTNAYGSATILVASVTVLEGHMVLFADDFEGNTLNAFWTKTENSGAVVFPSTVQKHSGQQAVQFSSTANTGQKNIDLHHAFATQQYGSVSLWVFDSGADLGSGNYLALRIGSVALGLSASIAAADYDLGPSNGGCYYYGIDYSTLSTNAVTTVDRTQAWHQFYINSTPAVLTLSIDGQVVYQGPGGVAFDMVEFDISGPTWRPAFSAYFDDFAIATLTNVAPAITSQPASQTNNAGANINLSVTANGAGPLSFQWYNGTNQLADGGRINGATSNQLTIANSLLSDAGNYTVVITNVCGSVTSEVAVVSVTPGAPWNKILFSRYNGGGSGIYIMNPDGSGIQQLTYVAGSWATTGANDKPFYCPANGRVYFNSNRDGYADWDNLYSMKLDGSDLVALTADDYRHGYFALDPAGGLIYYSYNSGGSSRIDVMNLDGSNQHQAAWGGGKLPYAINASGQLLYTSNSSDLWRINLDGTDNRLLINSQFGNATWSPDGQWVLGFRGNWELWKMRADGSELSRIDVGSLAVNYAYPGFTPDGQKLIFAATTQLDVTPFDLYMANLDGSGLTNLTQTPDFDERTPYAFFVDTLTNGLAAYYPFNGNANDASGNGNHGVVDSATLVPDRAGNLNSAYSFAPNANITINNDFGGLREFTMAGWFNVAPDGAEGEILMQTANCEVFYSPAQNVMEVFLYPSRDGGGSFTLNPVYRYTLDNNFEANWRHLAMVGYSNDVVALYLNGVLLTESSHATNNQTWPHNYATIGAGRASFGTAYYAKALIDDVRFYYRALTLSEVQTLAMATATVTAPVIALQPQSVSVSAGTNLNLAVTATGATPLSYQWRINGTNLLDGGRVSGATSTNLTIRIAQGSDAGNYSVVVTNGSGAITSQVALVTILNAPVEVAGMVWIPPGTFTMGSSANEQDRNADEGPQTTVTLTEGFWMAQCEVTQGAYLALTGSNPSSNTGDLNRPVEMMNWLEATNYCALLTAQELGAGRLPAGYQYRLPTEAEWEYACRAGTVTRLSYGDDPSYTQLGEYAWYSVNAGNRPNPVGQKKPNPWGLYDMYGNIYELCGDWYAAYPGGALTDPRGPVSGTQRVGRGAAFNYPGANFRSAYRGKSSEDQRDSNVGFRVVLAKALASPPLITSQPQPQSVMAGTTVNVAVTATGATPLSYQWRKNGTDLVNGDRISGSTSNQLTISSCLSADAGNYTVVITNNYGSVTSQVAVVSIAIATPWNKILFSRGNSSGSGIYVMNADGSGIQQLSYSTGSWGTTGLNSKPIYCPANGRIYFSSNRDGYADWVNLYSMKLDGSDLVALTTDDYRHGQYALDPVGNLMYYLYNNGSASRIDVMNLDGGNQHPSAWGDGKTPFDINASGQLLYTSNNSDLWRINLDGTDNRLLINSQFGNATWSPDGQWILGFQGNWELWKMRADGSGLSRIDVGSLAVGYAFPRFTPDGQKLLFSATPQLDVVPFDIYMANLDGSGLTNLTQTPNFDEHTPYAFFLGEWPTLAVQPQSQSMLAGQRLSLSVTATGLGPIAYQWRKDGTNLLNGGRISGVASNQLSITNIQLGDAGNYTVVITNSYGAATSQVAVIGVRLPVPDQWTEVVVATNINSAYSFKLADIDNDGYLDIVGTLDNQQLVWWENVDGQGRSFTPHLITPLMGSINGRIEIADIDKDGYLDIVSTETSSWEVRLYKNNGGGQSWTPITVFNSGGMGPLSLALVDFDQDGDIDVLTTKNYASQVFWVENVNGLGTSWSPHLLANRQINSFGTGDINGDGKPDLVLHKATLDWYPQTGTAVLGAAQTLSSEYGSSRVLDMDQDGDMDILSLLDAAPSAGWYMAWWENASGDGTTFARHGINSPWNIKYEYDFALMDYDKNGSVDIVAIAHPDTTNVVFWLENQGARTTNWTPHVITTNYAAMQGLAAGDLNGDGISDIVVGSTATTSLYVLLGGMRTPGAPVVTQSPASQSVAVGTEITLSVTATGTAPLSYQWRKDGANLVNGGRISGAVSNQLTINSCQLSDAGNYLVVVTNTSGSATSQVSVVTVDTPPSITQPATNQGLLAGTALSLSVTPTGTAPFGYQWRKDGTNLVDGGRISGATSNQLTIANSLVSDGGTYSVVVTNAYGSATILVAMVTVLDGHVVAFADDFEGGALNAFWTKTENSGSVVFPSTVQKHSGQQAVQFSSTYNTGQKNIDLHHTFATPQYGSVSLWVFDSGADLGSGNYLAMRISSVALGLGASIAAADYDLGPSNGGCYSYGIDYRTLSTNSVTTVDRTQAWHHFYINSTPAALTISVDGQVVYQGPGGVAFDTVEFDISGPTWRPAFSAYFDDFAIATLTNVAPAITSQPASQTNNVGANVTLSVTANGASPLSYQWYNGTNQLADGGRISGANSNQLTIANSLLSDAGNYIVVITNVCGSVISQVAVVTVGAPPAITQPATNQNLLAGTALSLSVTLTGTAPFGYQWRKDGTNLVDGGRISGATSNQLNIANSLVSDGGTYSVVVTNAYGSATILVAMVTVLDGQVVVFADDFEGGALNAFWTKTENSGSVVFPSTVQKHSGQQAVQFSSTANTGQKNIDLHHAFATPQYGSVSLWVFDSGADLGSGNYLALRISSVALGLGASIAAADYDLGPSNGGCYYYGIDYSALSTNSVTTVDRTQAWHHFYINSTPAALTISIDGQVVYQGPGGVAFDTVEFDISGPTWRPAFSAYFDDFAIATLTNVAPAITSQPVGQTNNAGANINLSITANGASPLSYQWYHGANQLTNGGQISGANSNQLTIANSLVSDAGNYTVVITNVCGSVTSEVAVVNVTIPVTPPIIALQPVGAVAVIGGQVSLSAGASGTGALTYQWRKNGTNLVEGGQISGAASTNLVISNVTVADSGSYQVVVSNAGGSTPGEVVPVVVGANVALAANGGRLESFTSQYAPAWGAAMLIDGLNGDNHSWCSPAYPGPQEFVLSFSNHWNAALGGVVIQNYGEDAYYSRGFELLLSPDNNNWTLVLSGQLSNTISPQLFALTNSSARYVKLRVTSGYRSDYWELGEVAVHGALIPDYPPTISDVANQTVAQDTVLGPLTVTISDPETTASALALTGRSANTALVPNANIVLGGSGSNRTVTITPAAGQTGTATITLTVSDGFNTASDSFVLTVQPPNQAPTVAITSPSEGAVFGAGANVAISAQAADADGSVSTVQFYAGITYVGTASNAPYSVIWSNVAAGAYALTARATDNQGASTTSIGVNITVLTNQSINLTIIGGGSVAKAPDKVNYAIGENLTLTAIPARWYQFSQWGDGVVATQRVVTVGSVNNYTATFILATALETNNYGGVTRVGPVGMPAVFVDGVFVPEGSVTKGNSAQITMQTTWANATILYTLDGSTPNFLSSQYSVPITVTNSVVVRAMAMNNGDFSTTPVCDPVQVTIVPVYSLSVLAPGGGSVAVNPATGPYLSNMVVTVSATASNGWSFMNWTGDLSGSNATIQLTMNGNKSIQAIFGTPVNRSTNGNGSVMMDPSTGPYAYGSKVTLTAVPNSGAGFALWGSAAAGNSFSPLRFIVTNANPTVSALFSTLGANQYSLTLMMTGQGTITMNPARNVFNSGEQVTLTATPDTGWSFANWSGDATSQSNVLVLTMNGNKAVTANFLFGSVPQTITFAALPDKTYGDAPFNLSASASSGLSVSFAVVSGPVSLNGNLLSLTGAGTVWVRATQAGNNTYAAATPVERSFTVARASQTINFPSIADKTLGVAPFALNASASSSLPVAYRVVSGPATLAGNMVTLTGGGLVQIEAAQAGDVNYLAAASVTNSFTVNVTPSIIRMTTNLVAVTGSNAVFWVEAGGTAPLSYQWQIQNNLQWQDLTGETATNFAIAHVAQQNTGVYRVVVRNAVGTTNSEAITLVVVDPPQIVAQPLSQSVPQGSTVDLGVMATGTAPMAYQWRLNATNLAGATTNLLHLANVQTANSGDYTVVISNAGGAVTSAVARVLVSGPPTIVSQPQGTNVVEGAEASFSVQATGAEPLNYQWHFNGVLMEGQNQATLAVSNLLAINAGEYQVLVGNPYGSLLSDPAMLTVVTAGTNTTTQVRGEYWVTDGRVAALAEANGALYIGGEFATVWPHTGSGAVLDPVSGAVNAGFPDINGEVDAAVSDGLGGWYIGGNFTMVGGAPRQRLAHLLPGKQVDPEWAPSVNAPVLAMALSEGKLYIGGSFTNVNGQARNRLAALNTINGAPDAWNPDVDGPVYALAVSGSTLYAGGQFGLVKGQVRQNVAAMPKVGSSEPIASWNPGANHTVLALAVGGDGTLYLGGQFQAVAGQSRKYLAALDAEGILQAWNPGPNNRVFALALSGTTVYAGGDFTMIGGGSRSYLAGLTANPVSGGAVTSWTPALNNTVLALAVSGGNVYAGGQFSTANSQGRSKLAAYDTVTGSLKPWNPNANGTIKVLAGGVAGVYAGGLFNIMGPQPRSKLAAMDLQTGQLLPWNPAANGYVSSLAVGGTNVIVGGDFTWVGGRERHYVAGLDMVSGLANAWDPNADGPVRALAVRENTVYAGGAFHTIGSQSRSYVAALALELNSGMARAEWNPGVDNLVLALAVSGSTVYLGGDFGVVSGTNRSCLAAVDAVTGVLKGWDPMANDRVQTLSCVGSNVYAGGDFTQIGGQARTNVAALDGTTGAVRSWNAGLQGQEVGGRGSVASVREENGLVYVGGGFNRLGGQARQNLGVVSASSGGATSWRADVNGPVSALSVSGGAVYVGGQFSQVGEYNRPNLAVIVPKGPPSLISQPLSQTVVAGPDSSVTLRVIAGGQSPLYYQWSFKGTNIMGATNSTLTFNGVYTTNAGTYQVVVSNLLGVITSGSAFLTVNAMPTITSQLTNIIVSQYSDVAFTASAAGSPPFSYQWRLNGVNIPNATNATYTITNAVATNSGSYSYAVKNNYGSVNSDPFVLIVDPGYFGMSDRFADRPWTNSAYGSIRCYNTNATHEAYEPLSHVKNGTKYGNQSVWLAWRAPATGMARFSTRGSGFDTLLAVYAGTNMTTLTNVVCDEDGGGFLTSAVSFNAVQDREYQIVVDGLGRGKGHIILKWEMELATDDVPEIDEDVVAQTTAKLGQKVMLKVKARNRRGSEEGLRYQWYCRSQPVPQATNSTLTIDSVQLGDIGNYVVEVYTQYKRIASAPAHVEIWGGNQSLTDLPNTEDKLFDVVKTLSGGQASPQGLGRRRKANTATPGLETTGSQLLSNFGATKEMYEPNHAGEIGGSSRWFTITPEQDGLLWLDTAGSAVPVVLAVYEGSEISSLSLKGSDNNPENGVASLWMPATAATNYLVAVDAKNGANGKINLNWLMGSLPGITNTLVDQAMWQGGTVSLSVCATGYPTPTFQWLFNGQPLSGETGSTLTLNNVTVEMTGKYSVQMSNVFGVLPSLEVQVTVTNAVPLVSHWTRNADTLTLLGRGFDLQLANNQVWFGAVRAAVLSGNSTQLVVRIPLGAAYGPVSVANPYGRTYSAQLYLPVYAPGALDQNSYNLAVPVSAGSGVSQTLLGDIDGDGLPDLVVLDQASSTISVYQNTSANGVTVYTNRFDVATPAGPVAAALGDLDGDGRLDLAVVSQTAEVVSVYRNVGGSWGANLFSERVGLSAGARPSCVALGDLDGDGRLDIAVGNMYDSSISLWRNQSVAGLMSPASFATRLDLPSPGWPVGVAIGDMDGDGRLDLVTVDGFYEYVTVYRNEGLGANWGVNGVSRTLGWAGPQPAAVGLGDVDGDGRLDVIVANEGNNTVSVLRNTSSSVVSLAARVEYSVGSKPRGLALGDVDGDGKLDVLAACDNGANGGVVSVLRNTGLSQVTSGSFASALNYAAGTGAHSVVLGDVNGDTLPELGVATGTGVVLLRQQRLNQTITFGALGDRLLGEAPLALGATASSGLPVSYQVISGPAALNGNMLTLTGGGVVVIEAQQAGDGHYLAAAAVGRSFTVRLALTVNATTGGTVTGVGGGTVANLIFPSSGGRLESFTSQYAPAWGAAMLTDGGKTGGGASWCSPVNPGPQSFVWSFANQQVAQMEEMVVYNYGEGASGLYCRAFTAYSSLDGQAWTPQISGELLAQEGPQRFNLGGAIGQYVKLVITSGYHADYWELSEVEVMGRFVYDTGASVTVNATANSGYRFVSWTENGNVVSTSASYAFAASANRTLVANFVAVYGVEVSAQPSSGGTATGGGTYDSGASVTVTAMPNAGYQFVNWTENGTSVSSTTNYTFTACTNRALVGNFEPAIISSNLLMAASGGSLVSFTAEYHPTWGAAKLTDGGKGGAGVSWCGPANPGPQSFVWRLAGMGQMTEMAIHNFGEGAYYCRGFSISTSTDGRNWTPGLSGELLAQEGAQRFSLGSVTARYIKLVITSGYRSDYWELGEVEVLGRLMPENLVSPTLGGKLESFTSEYHPTWGAAMLTDGGKSGAGASWASPANPGPQSFVWSFGQQRGAQIEELVVYNYGEGSAGLYCRNFTVSISTDGQNWTPQLSGELLAQEGAQRINLGGVTAQLLKLTITSGYRSDYWELGEVEVLGKLLPENLASPAQGGKLESFTSEYHPTWGAAMLTDGGKSGAGASWASPANPGPQSFVWSLAGMGQMNEVMIYNYGEGAAGLYCRNFTVSTSNDGQNWTAQLSGELLAQEGAQRFSLGGVTAQSLKLTITSGYRSDYWELGEVEVMGRLLPENLALPAKGGKLESFTAEYHPTWGAAMLTDGGKGGGVGVSWASPANPVPQSFVWSFTNQSLVRIDEMVLYNYGEGADGMYSRAFTVQTSLDKQTWTPQMSGELLAQEGAQLFSIGAVVRYVKLTITSGYRSDYWELGEVEVMGRIVTNDNLLLPAKGGKLESFTAEYHSTWGAAMLTDGGKSGAGVSWCGPANPGPQSFVWSFAGQRQAQLDELVVYNYGEGTVYYSRGFSVYTSLDNQTWTQQMSGELLAQEGPQRFNLGGVTGRYVKLVIASGYQSDYWELGEVEVMGTLK